MELEFNSLININSVKPDDVVDQWEEEQHEKLMQAYIADSGIPVDYRGCSFDSYECKTESQKKMKGEAEHALDRMVAGEYMTVVFAGAYGTGKTHLGNAILISYLRNCQKDVYGIKTPRKIKYISSSDLCDEYKEAESFSAKEKKSQLLKRYKDYDLLFVDEVGRGVSNIEAEILFQLQDGRDHLRHPTIYATNLSSEEFMKLGGKAFMDRIKCSMFLIENQGKTFRFLGLLGGRR